MKTVNCFIYKEVSITLFIIPPPPCYSYFVPKIPRLSQDFHFTPFLGKQLLFALSFCYGYTKLEMLEKLKVEDMKMEQITIICGRQCLGSIW